MRACAQRARRCMHTNTHSRTCLAREFEKCKHFRMRVHDAYRAQKQAKDAVAAVSVVQAAATQLASVRLGTNQTLATLHQVRRGACSVLETLQATSWKHGVLAPHHPLKTLCLRDPLIMGIIHSRKAHHLVLEGIVISPIPLSLFVCTAHHPHSLKTRWLRQARRDCQY